MGLWRQKGMEVESKIAWRTACGSVVHQRLHLIVCVGERRR